jgi:uncharacterized protein
MAGISKRQADAYDRILEAAEALAELIEFSAIEIDEDALEELTIYLARNAPEVKTILKGLRQWP